MILEKKELLNIKGGAISAALINAISNALETLYEFGKIVGKNIGDFFFKSC